MQEVKRYKMGLDVHITLQVSYCCCLGVVGSSSAKLMYLLIFLGFTLVILKILLEGTGLWVVEVYYSMMA